MASFVGQPILAAAAFQAAQTLKIPENSRPLMVAAAIRAGDTGFQRYRLDAYVVMPNHVHMLATPSVPSPSWLGPLKGFTAHEANRILGTAGSRFWQDESYDHLVRDGEFERIRRYIEWNPVRAGLAANPEEFPWCSAAKSDAAWKGGGSQD